MAKGCLAQNLDRNIARLHHPINAQSGLLTDDYRLRVILSVFANPHFLHTSESSSNALPNRTGLTRMMPISIPQPGHVDDALSGGIF
jgi:hypothetical protein